MSPVVVVAERVRVRDIDDAEEGRLLRIVRRGSGAGDDLWWSQMILLSAKGPPVGKIAGVTFTSAERSGA